MKYTNARIQWEGANGAVTPLPDSKSLAEMRRFLDEEVDPPEVFTGGLLKAWMGDPIIGKEVAWEVTPGGKVHHKRVY